MSAGMKFSRSTDAVLASTAGAIARVRVVSVKLARVKRATNAKERNLKDR
jgi:hypothetical protein